MKPLTRMQGEIKAGQFIECSYGQATQSGLRTLELLHKDTPVPIGIVWYRWVGNGTVEIMHSYVQERFRRLGVRTRLHKFLVQSYPGPAGLKRIVTATGNAKSIPWLRKMGFTRCPLTADYTLVVNRHIAPAVAATIKRTQAERTTRRPRLWDDAPKLLALFKEGMAPR